MVDTAFASDASDLHDMDVLEKAFAATWQTIQAHDPCRDPRIDSALKDVIRRQLVALAAEGATDAVAMRNKVLGTLPLSPSKPVASR